MSLTNGQLAIAYLLKRDLANAQDQFTQCLIIAKELKAHKMHLECLLCLAYISFDKSEWQGAEDFFNQAYFVSVYSLNYFCTDITLF